MIEEEVFKNGDTISCICGHFKIVLKNNSSYADFSDDIIVCKSEKRKGIIIALQSLNSRGISHLFRDKFELLTVQIDESMKYDSYLLTEKNIFIK